MSYFCIREWEHHEVPRCCEMNCSPVLETHIQAHIYAQTSKSLPVTSYTVHAVIESSYIRDQHPKWKILMHLRCTALWEGSREGNWAQTTENIAVHVLWFCGHQSILRSQEIGNWISISAGRTLYREASKTVSWIYRLICLLQDEINVFL